MLLHPGVISLFIGSAIVTLMVCYAALTGIKVLRRWDIKSSSAGQLALERKTYLLSTLMNYALGFEVLSTLLFVFTAEDLHGIFVGAMCATGTLNANPVGWSALQVKLAVFFAAGLWILLNRLDQSAEDYPLTRLKYALLLPIAPLVLLDTYLQTDYFLGLEPDIITSCCGALFSAGGEGLASEMAALPLRESMIAFYATAALYVLSCALFRLLPPKPFLKPLLAWSTTILAALFFGVSLASVIAFISVYFYELPTHHCPFDLFQGFYGYVGYPLYLSLFGSALFGLATGPAELFTSIPSLRDIIEKAQRRWVTRALLLALVFLVISTWPVITGDFTMEGYF